jgi:hypothetical protein
MTVSKSTGGKTPFELWTRSKPVVSHLRVFGCIAHVKNTRPNLKQLEDRSKPMMFVGYEPRSAAYRFYDPNTKHVCISRDVVFYEEGAWKWSVEQAAEMDSEFIIEGETEFFQTTSVVLGCVEVAAPAISTANM